MSLKNQEKLIKQRPPIVVVMGHVDHGKTKLLDYIRKTNVAEKEAGGITQSIGAYEIVHNGKKITFVDTPGHEAFSKMREHGAKIADFAILVVAADEGVKPQTEDALKYILKEGMPYIVTINKIDKRNADPERVKQQLNKLGVALEGAGGNVSWQAISAKTGTGINELLDLLVLAAEVENLTYNPENPAKGVVLTVHIDSQRGIVAGGIITDGSLKKGDDIFTASARGKVKILEDFRGNQVELLKPSAPVMILGFESMPEVGEEFSSDIQEIQKPKTKIEAKAGAVEEKLETSLKVILKANEAGSLSALLHIIEKISKETSINIIDKSLGNIYESDVKLAASTGAIIVGFKVKADKAAVNMAKMQDLVIMTSEIIYELEKDLEEYLQRNKSRKRRIIEILKSFSSPKGGRQIVGGRVIVGPIKNQEKFEVLEENKSVGRGKIINLQSNRQDIAEAEEGSEVGLLVEADVEIKVGYKLIFEG